MRINNNLMAMNTQRQLGLNATSTAKSVEKLSSGLRINRAGDDAAGLAISEKMRSQIRGLNQASRNAQDGISLVQTAEGALQETQDILQRLRELSVQSATGTNTDADRSTIQNEVSQLKSEIDRIGDTTEFNTKKLLNGSLKAAEGATIGSNSTVGAQIAKLTAGKMSASASISGQISDGNFVAEDINIDGTTITVHWESLSTEDKATLKNAGSAPSSQNKAKDLILNTINAAIDAAARNIDHVTGYVDTSGHFIMESGSKGINSIISAGGGGVLEAAAAGGTGTSGSAVYNGTDIAAADSADMYVGDLLLKMSMTAAVSGGTTTLSAAASTMSDSINTAISAYNTATGKTSGVEGYVEKVTVSATADGRLQINSQTAEVRFKDVSGGTLAKDLGLTEAQTSASGSGGVTFQIGANKSQTLQFGIGDMRSAALAITGVDVSTAAGAQNAITSIDSALKKVSDERSKLGSVQNRLEHTIKNLDTSAENLQSSESRIRDVDMAKEMMSYTKNNILQQAAQAMLAQANQAPQGVLQLLR